MQRAVERQKTLGPIVLDIIGSLPDATFAINLQGKVIAWNSAMEAMSGVKARDMLFKGDYEYAIPFYHHRRPLLIDLVLAPDEDMKKHYTSYTRDNEVLICEAEMIDRKGCRRDIWGKASPFRNSDGDIVGAIEIVRDITDKKRLVKVEVP
jgi:PAS domain-containing protein